MVNLNLGLDAELRQKWRELSKARVESGLPPLKNFDEAMDEVLADMRWEYLIALGHFPRRLDPRDWKRKKRP